MCVCSLCVVVLFENLNHKPRTTLKKPNDLEFGVWRLAFGVWRLAFGVVEYRLRSCPRNTVSKYATRVFM